MWREGRGESGQKREDSRIGYRGHGGRERKEREDRGEGKEKEDRREGKEGEGG